MSRKNKHSGSGFSTILLVFMVIMPFCITVSSAQTSPDYLFVNEGQNIDLDEEIVIAVYIYDGGTLNLLDNAIVHYVQVKTGGTLNIKGGTIDGTGIINYADSFVKIYGKYVNHSPKDGAKFNSSYNSLDIVNSDVGWSGDLTCKYEGASTESIIPFSAEANIQFTVPPTPPTITVQIDIKPGNEPPNPINPGSNGLIPVAILTTETFFAEQVDPSTVTLAGHEVAVRGKAENLMERLEDVDGDGDLDLLVQVETYSDELLWESGFVILTGNLFEEFGGNPIEGQDEIIVVPPE